MRIFYAHAWQRLRSLETTIVTLLLGSAAILGTPTNAPWSRSLIDFLSLAMLAAAAAYYLKLRAWSCPRCGHAFCADGPMRERRHWRAIFFIARQCGFCGLEKYAASDAETIGDPKTRMPWTEPGH